jgi:Arc/MetJ-type ribon-helix-helix transcriptional regulator
MRGKKEGLTDADRSRTVRVSVRVGRDVLRRAARLEDHVGRRLGARASRADVLRAALMRGLALLESARSDDE